MLGEMPGMPAKKTDDPVKGPACCARLIIQEVPMLMTDEAKYQVKCIEGKDERKQEREADEGEEEECLRKRLNINPKRPYRD